eukprot:g7953.t1
MIATNPIHQAGQAADAAGMGTELPIIHVSRGIAQTGTQGGLLTIKDARDIRAAIKAMDLDELEHSITVLREYDEQLKGALQQVAAADTEQGNETKMLGGDLARDDFVTHFVDVADTMHNGVCEAKTHARQMGLRMSPDIEREDRQLMYGHMWDGMLEVINETSDIIFLVFSLRAPGTMDLFWASFGAMMLTLVARLIICGSVWRKVDPEKVWRFVWGVSWSLIEPLSGGRLLKTSFREAGTTGGQVWSVAAQKFVAEDRDPRVVRAINNLAAARTDLRNSLVLVGVEDVPELVIEIVYLLRTGQQTLNTLFVVTAIGTTLHIARQLYEARQLKLEIPELERTIEYREKAFEPEEACDADVVAFAQSAAGSCGG